MMFRPLLMLSCGSVEVSHGKIRVRLNNGIITFVIIDGTRHGSGAVLCNTQVWTYNTSNNTWSDLLPSEDGCSGAKFISGKTAIRVTLGEVTNFETAAGSADYEYEFRDIDIPLK